MSQEIEVWPLALNSGPPRHSVVKDRPTTEPSSEGLDDDLGLDAVAVPEPETVLSSTPGLGLGTSPRHLFFRGIWAHWAVTERATDLQVWILFEDRRVWIYARKSGNNPLCFLNA